MFLQPHFPTFLIRTTCLEGDEKTSYMLNELKWSKMIDRFSNDPQNAGTRSFAECSHPAQDVV